MCLSRKFSDLEKIIGGCGEIFMSADSWLIVAKTIFCFSTVLIVFALSGLCARPAHTILCKSLWVAALKVWLHQDPNAWIKAGMIFADKMSRLHVRQADIPGCDSHAVNAHNTPSRHAGLPSPWRFFPWSLQSWREKESQRHQHPQEPWSCQPVSTCGRYVIHVIVSCYGATR